MWFVITFDITEINITVNTLVSMPSPYVGKEKFRIVSGTALMAVLQTAGLKKAGSFMVINFRVTLWN